MHHKSSRDFPYNDHYGDNKSCMKTITARVIAEIYKAQMIRISVTIHGGIETISRLWGSPNHARLTDGLFRKKERKERKKAIRPIAFKVRK